MGFKKYLKKLGKHIVKAHQHYRRLVPKESRREINGKLRKKGDAGVEIAANKAGKVGGPIAKAEVQRLRTKYTNKIETKLSENANKNASKGLS